VASHTGLAFDEQLTPRLAYLFQALDQRQVEPRLWLVFAKDPLPRTRLEAVRVLASVADPDTVRVLSEFSSDSDDRVRQLVMLAAGRTGAAATGLVTRGLADDSPAVRQAAMWAAAQLGDDGWEIIAPRLESERDPLVIETLLGNISSFGDRPWRAVAARFARSANPNLRRAVAAGLARAGADDSLAVLARDPEPVIRATAVAGFGRGPWTPAYGQIILAAARDADWRVRAAAFGVLAASPDLGLSDADRAVIESAVTSKHAQERVPAIRAAAVQKGVMSVADLMAVTKSDGPWAASEALVAAVLVDATTALPEVARWLKSPDMWRRRAAARAVASGADGLGEEAAPLVDRLTKDAEPSVRLAWLESLPPRDVVDHEKTLDQLLSQDPDPMVRAAVIDVLRGADRLGDSQRWLELVTRWRGDEAPDARAAAYAAALAATDASEERAPILERAMSDPDDGVRCLVADGARGLGIPVVAPPRDARHGAPWYRDLAHWVTEPHWLDIVTVRGTFRVRLDAADAPLSAREIFDLAASGRYDGLDIHRVVPNFVVQGGDPRGDGWGGPGFTLADEPSLVPFDSGSVGIATGGRHTGGSQLFAMLLPADRLTGHYTHLGAVVAGRDVLERLEVGDRILRVETADGPIEQLLVDFLAPAEGR
jgi:cyclophilin family peptidyl-prolyl cis-trans isomerase/HEAT repeat protein